MNSMIKKLLLMVVLCTGCKQELKSLKEGSTEPSTSAPVKVEGETPSDQNPREESDDVVSRDPRNESPITVEEPGASPAPEASPQDYQKYLFPTLDSFSLGVPFKEILFTSDGGKIAVYQINNSVFNSGGFLSETKFCLFKANGLDKIQWIECAQNSSPEKYKTIELTNIIESESGKIVVVGNGFFTKSSGYAATAGFIFIYTSEGQLLSKRIFSDISEQPIQFHSVREVSDGWLIAGHFHNTNAPLAERVQSGALLKLDRNLNVVWNKNYPQLGTFSNILPLSDGVLASAGPSIVKFNNEGEVVWALKADLSQYNRRIHQMILAPNGMVYASGAGWQEDSNLAFLFEVDTLNGVVTQDWDFVYPPNYSTSFKDLIWTSDDKIALVGEGRAYERRGGCLVLFDLNQTESPTVYSFRDDGIAGRLQKVYEPTPGSFFLLFFDRSTLFFSASAFASLVPERSANFSIRSGDGEGYLNLDLNPLQSFDIEYLFLNPELFENYQGSEQDFDFLDAR